MILEHEATSDVAALVDQTKSLFFHRGPTVLLDAIFLASEYLARQTPSSADQPAGLILITDGDERASYTSQETLLKTLRERHHRVFTIAFTTSLRQERAYFPQSESQLEAAVREILSLIHKPQG